MSVPARKKRNAKPVMVPLSIDPSTLTLQGASRETGRKVTEGWRRRRGGNLKPPIAVKNWHRLRPFDFAQGRLRLDGRRRPSPHELSSLRPSALVFAGLFGSQVAGLADLVDVQASRREFGNLASAP